MPLGPMNTVATVIPTMLYRDAPAAIDWLCRVFGFERRAVHGDDTGRVFHAELGFGNGMIMLSSASTEGFGAHFIQPDEAGGRVSQCCCLIVADPDAHYERAIAEGAQIIDPIADKGYGGRGFGCRDLEGHLWWFGSYDPWAA